MKSEININGIQSVSKIENGQICLTDLWILSGSDKNRSPYRWQKLDQTIGFCEGVSGLLKVDLKSLFTKTKGRSGKTYAHPQIALAYAKYLDPKLHVLVNQTFFERIEEEKNPDLIIDRARRTYKKKGKSDEWINNRLRAKATRNNFTSMLKAHGVENDGFRHCTNAIYEPLFGGTTAVVRMKKGLEKKENIRDNLSGIELSAVEFSEALARDTIDRNDLRGNAQCEMASRKSSRIVADAIKKSHN